MFLKHEKSRRLLQKALALLLAFLIVFTGINFGGMTIGGPAKAYAAGAIPWSDLSTNSGDGTKIVWDGQIDAGNTTTGAGKPTRYADISGSGITVIMPEMGGEVGQPERYLDADGKCNMELKGWLLVPNESKYKNGDGTYHSLRPEDIRYYEPGEEVTIDESFIDSSGEVRFLADWRPTSYDFGSSDHVGDGAPLGGLRDDIVKTDSIRINLYDVNGSIYNVLHSWMGRQQNFNDAESGPLFIDENIEGAVHGKTPTRPVTNYIVSGADGYKAVVNAWNAGRIGEHKEGASQGLWDHVDFTQIFNDNTLGVTHVGNASNGQMYWIGTKADGDYEGYYLFDSRKSAAAYNQSEQRFYIYNRPQPINTSNGLAVLPLNAPKDSAYSYSDGSINYHFGMLTEIDFFLTGKVPDTIPKEGEAKVNQIEINGQKKDMIFYFSGDDDVFVFVDGKLALDIGGIHDATEGTINFATGVVWTKRVSGRNQGTEEITNNASIAGLDAGNHRLTIYYMERGGAESNNKTAFLLTIPATIKVKKIETQTGEPVVYPGTQFLLQKKDGEYYHLQNKAGDYYLKQDKYGLWLQAKDNAGNLLYEEDGKPKLVLDSESADPLSVPSVSYRDSKADACIFEANDEGAVEMRYVVDGDYVLTEIGAPEYYEGLPGSIGFKVENAKIIDSSLAFYEDNEYESGDKPYTYNPDWSQEIDVNGEEVTLKVGNERKTHPIILTKNFDDKRIPKGVTFSFYEIKAPTIADKKIAKDENYDPTYEEKITIDKDSINKDEIPENARLVYEGTTNKYGELADIKWYPLGKEETPEEMVKPGEGELAIEAPELKEGSVYYITEGEFVGDGNYYSMGAPVVVLVTDKGIELVSDTTSDKFVFEKKDTVNFTAAKDNNPAKLEVTNVPITIEEPEKFVDNEKAGTPFKELTEDDKAELVENGVITKDEEGYKKDGELVGDDEVLIPALALEGRDKVFTYTITQKIPAKATKVVITDVLKSELEIVGEPTIDSDEFTVSVYENTVTATTGDEDKDLTALVDKVVTLTIVAKIRDGVTDAELIEKYDSTSVPNE